VAVNPELDRRRAPRVAGQDAEAGRELRLRTGHPATMINYSSGGMAIETDACLAPGSALDLVFVAEGQRASRRMLVVHARVCGLDPAGGVRYRIGLRRPGFDRPSAEWVSE
jgi:hypothetical protein